MQTKEYLHLKIDGLSAILALSKHHNCNETVKGMAIDQLSKYVMSGKPNCFRLGLITFYMVFDKQMLIEYKQSPNDNALISYFDGAAPERSQIITAAREVVRDGYLIKFLNLIDLEG